MKKRSRATGRLMQLRFALSPSAVRSAPMNERAARRKSGPLEV